MTTGRKRPLLVLALVSLVLTLGAGPAVVAAQPDATAFSRGQGGPKIDSQDVLETLYEWSLGYDERDIEMMRNAFTDDATFIYRSPAFDEPLVFSGIEEVMELFESSLAAQDDVRRHVVTNSIIERIDRRTVEVTSYLTLLVIADADQAPVLQSTGVYRDTLVLERDGQWRIQERDLQLDTAA